MLHISKRAFRASLPQIFTLLCFKTDVFLNGNRSNRSKGPGQEF